jgi:sigma-B regulation protein RsbU (phosphoserine phosphatase)
MAALPAATGSMPDIIPTSEAERLAAVHRYDVLDTPPDGAFERVTALAARLFDVPIATVSIVDEDRIWFKSHHGLDIQEISRDSGLCASAILQSEPWIVTDAAGDPRTLANPLVAGALGLRFYLGAPLTTRDGFNLGTLSVMDRKPRSVSDKDVATLTDLAAMVVDELELRRAGRRTLEMEQELRRQAEQFSAALQTSLLPPVLPAIPGVEIASFFQPADGAEVGGDFFDLFPVTPHVWAVVMGDVSGKGPLAASRSALARYSLRGAAVHGDSPAETLHRVNQALLAGDHLDDSFCTLVFGLIDSSPNGFNIRVAVGGHPLPTLLRKDGTVTAIGRSGSIVGSLPDTEFYDDSVFVEPGDTFVMVTDGLVEIHTAHGVSGMSEFENRLASCAGLPPDVMITRLAGAMNVNHDDAAILILQAV